MVDYTQPPVPECKQVDKPDYKKLQYLPKGYFSKGFQPSMVTSTIPSKYQTVMYEIPEKKGFGSRARRFDDNLNQSENPGPGTYDCMHAPLETFSTSFSKRGTGGLASKVPREQRKRIIHTPAANAYNIPSTILTKADYHFGNSSMFQPPIAMKLDNDKDRTPAPNEYNISEVFLGKANNVSAESAFLSRTKRGAFPQESLHGPSPCHYRISHSLTKESPKAMVSAFKSTTARLKYPTDSTSPGPATYQPYNSMAEDRIQSTRLHPWYWATTINHPCCGPLLEVQDADFYKEGIRMLHDHFTRKKHYMCISAPPFPVRRNPTPPGPGYYDVVNFHDPPKRYMTSAVFVSNTSRWTGNVHVKDGPGPASYLPKQKEKRSFLYNLNRKWVPS